MIQKGRSDTACRRSVSSGDCAPVEAIVQAEFDQVNLLVDVDSGGHPVSAAKRAEQRDPLVAEIKEVILELGRPVAVESVFNAGAEHPAGASFAGGDRKWIYGLGPDETVLVMRPGDANFSINHPAVPSITNTRCQGADPVRLCGKRSSTSALREQKRVGRKIAFDIAPGELPFDTDHPARTKLMIAAGLHAPKESVDVGTKSSKLRVEVGQDFAG